MKLEKENQKHFQVEPFEMAVAFDEEPPVQAWPSEAIAVESVTVKIAPGTVEAVGKLATVRPVGLKSEELIIASGSLAPSGSPMEYITMPRRFEPAVRVTPSFASLMSVFAAVQRVEQEMSNRFTPEVLLSALTTVVVVLLPKTFSTCKRHDPLVMLRMFTWVLEPLKIVRSVLRHVEVRRISELVLVLLPSD